MSGLIYCRTSVFLPDCRLDFLKPAWRFAPVFEPEKRKRNSEIKVKQNFHISAVYAIRLILMNSNSHFMNIIIRKCCVFEFILFSKEFDIFYKLKDLMQCRVKSVVSFQADGFFPFIWWTYFVIPLEFAKNLSDTFAKFPRFFLYDWRKSSFCLKPSLHQMLITSFCVQQKSI